MSDLIQRAIELYTTTLQQTLETTHADWCVAIEPDSGTYFLGPTYSQAIACARQAYPDRLTYTLRIGQRVVVEIGSGHS